MNSCTHHSYVKTANTLRPIRFENQCNHCLSLYTYLFFTKFHIWYQTTFEKSFCMTPSAEVLMWFCKVVIPVVYQAPYTKHQRDTHAHGSGSFCGKQLPKTTDILQSTVTALCKHVVVDHRPTHVSVFPFLTHQI